MFGGEVKKPRVVGKAIKRLLAHAKNPKQAMWTGADDSLKLSYYINGVWDMASQTDQRHLYDFHQMLYQKYGIDNAFGWYKSLDNHTKNPKKSIKLYYKELLRFFARG